MEGGVEALTSQVACFSQRGSAGRVAAGWVGCKAPRKHPTNMLCLGLGEVGKRADGPPVKREKKDHLQGPAGKILVGLLFLAIRPMVLNPSRALARCLNPDLARGACIFSKFFWCNSFAFFQPNSYLPVNPHASGHCGDAENLLD